MSRKAPDSPPLQGDAAMMLAPQSFDAVIAPQAEHHPLGQMSKGFSGHVFRVAALDHSAALPAEEMERRLIELGFVEGAAVRILHEGLFGRDPIAVRVNGTTVALRRREAMAILVS